MPLYANQRNALMFTFRKQYSLYMIILFVILISLVLYAVLARGAPKLILIYIPVSIILAIGFYEIFKRS
jgi:hypothetical protein